MATKIDSLCGFVVDKVLNVDNKSKQIAVSGHFKRDPDHSVVIVVDKLPITPDTVQELFADHIDLKINLQNDIYGQFQVVSCKSLGDVKVITVYPASDKHIAKYSAQKVYMVRETPTDYEKITKPYIKSQSLGIEWVYNILNGKSEVDRVIYNDPDPLNGFIILPDLKWDVDDIDNLYLIAIVRRRDLLSLRDLTGDHLELLKRIRAKGKEVVNAVYGVQSNQLRLYIHYQPSFYHLHIHITNLKYDSSGVMVGRAHLLDDVIDNLENIDGEYYHKRILTFVLKESHELTREFKECN